MNRTYIVDGKVQHRFILNGREEYVDTEIVSWSEIVFKSYRDHFYAMNVDTDPTRHYGKFRVTWRLQDDKLKNQKNEPLWPHQSIQIQPATGVIVINCTMAHPVETCNCPVCDSAIKQIW